MTRKDYVTLAESIRTSRHMAMKYAVGERQDEQLIATDRTAKHVADALQSDNPRFDRERFLKACGVTR